MFRILLKDTFLIVVPIEEAVRIVRSIAHQTGSETIAIDDSDGRTLNEPVHAQTDIPGFDRSWRDGYAVIAGDLLNTSETSPASSPMQRADQDGTTVRRAGDRRFLHVHPNRRIPP